MTGRKTERLYTSYPLEADTLADTQTSFAMALIELEKKAHAEDREPLYDTLAVDIERTTADDRTLMEMVANTFQTYVTINVSAECVRTKETGAPS